MRRESPNSEPGSAQVLWGSYVLHRSQRLWGGAQAGHPGVIQSGEVRGRISLVFPSNPPSGSQSWDSIMPLPECPESLSRKESQEFGYTNL